MSQTSENHAAEPLAGDANALHDSRFKPLRIWPPVILLLGMIAAFIPHAMNPHQPTFQAIRMLGPALCGVLIMGWWLTISRANWQERLFGLLGVAMAFGITLLLLDPSMVGLPTIAVTIPIGMATFAIAAVLCRSFLSQQRTYIAIGLALLGFGFSVLLRGAGVWGDGSMILDWRFADSPEQRLVALRGNAAEYRNETALAKFEPETMDQWLSDPDWPGFRGGDRVSLVTGLKIDTDWASNPPEVIWQREVGPGWSSFSVAGKLLFTQEQRGEMETVVCYAADSGEELWTRGIESRFEDSIGGPGPRATPTIADGDLFVMGASGQLMRIDARTGEVKWEKDLREVADRKPPTWGFSASPLVIGSSVIVWCGGDGQRGTLAFDLADGELMWSVPAGNHSYSSPQICTVGGRSYVAMLTNAGLDLIDPDSGELAFVYDWKEPGYRVLQPQVIGGDSILLPTATGVRLIGVTDDHGGFRAEEIWSSRMKPDFNDLVVHEDYAYGFDGTIFCCVDLKTGEVVWKGGRYGKGQVLLLADSKVLLVVTERGRIVLVSPDPAAHRELGDFSGIRGKTWNHPALVGDRLYVRNSTEAACLRLPIPSSSP